MPELLLGAGSNTEKRFLTAGGEKTWKDLTTLDINADHNPDVVWDLNKFPLPFEDNQFDEIGAYEVLEHLGTQGDYRAWFGLFSELWRIMKPGAIFHGTSPDVSSRWCFGDPSHTRVVIPEMFTFLVQPEYVRQVGITPMSDFRFCYKADFDIVHLNVDNATRQFSFGIRAVKPSRFVPPSAKGNGHHVSLDEEGSGGEPGSEAPRH